MRDFGELIKEPVIRKVPVRIRLAIYLHKLSLIGALILIISIYLLSTQAFKVNFLLDKYYKEAKGEITNSWVIREEDEDNYALLAHEYIFYNNEIGQLSGISYGENIYYNIGEKINVQYYPSDHEYNRIRGLRGTRRATNNLTELILMISIGLVITSLGLIMGKHRIMYLQRGHITLAKRISNKKYEADGKPESPEEPLYTLIYQFKDTNGEDRYLSKVTKEKGFGEEIPVIFLSSNPHKAKFPEHWKNHVISSKELYIFLMGGVSV